MTLTEADQDEARTPARAFCYRCHKAASVCVCDSIPRVSNSTQVLVVQHPREQRHPIGSLRFARLGLERCHIEVAQNTDGAGLRAEVEFPPGAALLYPGEGSRELESLPANERPATLVLLDGTWSTVRRLLSGDPRLRALPRVGIAPKVAGNYRIRSEPRAECLSTLEALIEALRVLEPERDEQWDGLIAAFDSMIDRQIEIIAKRGRPRKAKRRSGRQFRAVPAKLGLEHGPMLVVNIESTQVNRIKESGTRRRRQIVRLSATRLQAGESPTHFDQIVRIEGDAPSEKQLQLMGIELETLLAGCEPTELETRWQAFAQPGDRVCAWNQVTIDLLPWPNLAAPNAAGDHLSYVLKGIFANLRHRRAGDLSAACALEGLEEPARAPSARGRDRLAAGLAMYEWLVTQRGLSVP